MPGKPIYSSPGTPAILWVQVGILWSFGLPATAGVVYFGWFQPLAWLLLFFLVFGLWMVPYGILFHRFDIYEEGVTEPKSSLRRGPPRTIRYSTMESYRLSRYEDRCIIFLPERKVQLYRNDPDVIDNLVRKLKAKGIPLAPPLSSLGS